jgi:hypothetical protein
MSVGFDHSDTAAVCNEVNTFGFKLLLQLLLLPKPFFFFFFNDNIHKLFSADNKVESWHNPHLEVAGFLLKKDWRDGVVEEARDARICSGGRRGRRGRSSRSEAGAVQ